MDDRGYGSVLALAMLLGGALLLGVAVDLTRLLAEWRTASHLASTAAETGAGWVVPGALYDGRIVVDGPRASDAAQQVVAASGRSADIEVTAGSVCVTVRSEVSPRIARLVGAPVQPVAAMACASPRQG